jgi:hypothetical protein
VAVSRWEIVAEKLTHIHKLASLVPGDPGSYNSEKVANRRGVNLRSFESERQAIAWLREPAAAG